MIIFISDKAASLKKLPTSCWGGGGKCKLNGKRWGFRKSTLIYACSRKTAKEITVQTLPGNVKRVLKQIMEDLIVDLSKTPSRPFQAWKMERPRSYKMQGLRRGRAALLLGLCSAQLQSLLQTQRQTPSPWSGRTSQKFGGEALQNDLRGVEGAGGERWPGVQSSSQAHTTTSSKWQQTLGLLLSAAEWFPSYKGTLCAKW